MIKWVPAGPGADCFPTDMLNDRSYLRPNTLSKGPEMLADGTGWEHTLSPEPNKRARARDKPVPPLFLKHMDKLWGSKVSPEQNRGDVTARIRGRTRVAKPTEVHYNQNPGWTVKGIRLPPLPSHHTAVWYLSFVSLLWYQKAVFPPDGAPMTSSSPQ